MVAFEFEPETWPEEEAFDNPAKEGQLRYLRAIRENQPNCTSEMFRQLCGAILEEYGLLDQINEGSVDVLITFFSKSQARHKRAAERAAWSWIYGQASPL